MAAGRPKKYKITKRYLLTLDAELVEELDAILAEDDISRSAVINTLIKEYTNSTNVNDDE